MSRLGRLLAPGPCDMPGAPTALAANLAGRVIEVPAGFGAAPAFALTEGMMRGYTAAIDPRSRIITPQATLYVSTLGSNANPGTSPGAGAKRSLWSALSNAGAFGVPTTIYVEPGDYYYADAWGGQVVFGSDINLVGVGGPVRVFAEAGGIVWSSAGSGAYSGALAAAPVGFWDDAYQTLDGAGTWLVPRASVVDVQALGGWHWAASVATIKLADARSPDSFVHEAPAGVPAASGPNINSLARSLYVEGIEHCGWSRFFGQAYLNLTLNNAPVRHCSTNGIYFNNGTSPMCFGVRSVGHRGTGAGADGISYQAGSGDALEVGCIVTDNGWDGAGISNGSTGHGNRIIRCGGRAERNDGPNYADVFGTLSLNLGTMARNSRAGTAAQTANYCTDGAAGRMWIAGGYSSGSAAGNALYAIHADSRIYVRDTGYDGLVGAGQVASW